MPSTHKWPPPVPSTKPIKLPRGPLHFCGATLNGRVCIRPFREPDYLGYPHDQHRSADGKRWYYSDGEKKAAMKQSVAEHLARLEFQSPEFPIPAPSHARRVLGVTLINVGPSPGEVRWTGWSEVWERDDYILRMAFPPPSIWKPCRSEDGAIWIEEVDRALFRPYE